jgi:hypothetical protein
MIKIVPIQRRGNRKSISNFLLDGGQHLKITIGILEGYVQQAVLLDGLLTMGFASPEAIPSPTNLISYIQPTSEVTPIIVSREMCRLLMHI